MLIVDEEQVVVRSEQNINALIGSAEIAENISDEPVGCCLDARGLKDSEPIVSLRLRLLPQQA